MTSVSNGFSRLFEDLTQRHRSVSSTRPDTRFSRRHRLFCKPSEGFLAFRRTESLQETCIWGNARSRAYVSLRKTSDTVFLGLSGVRVRITTPGLESKRSRRSKGCRRIVSTERFFFFRIFFFHFWGGTGRFAFCTRRRRCRVFELLFLLSSVVQADAVP